MAFALAGMSPQRWRCREGTFGLVAQLAAEAGVEFTNGDQPGVRLTKAAAAHSRQTASGSAAAGKAARGKTAKATGKKR